MLPVLQDLPAPLLALVAERLTSSDLGRLACCSRELRGRVYVAWPADPEALCLAACHGNLVLLRVQLGAGVPVDTTASGRTALMHAAERGQDGAVLALLEAGANFSHSDAFGRTALTRAAGCGHELVVQALLAAGAAVDQAVGGRTALRCAAAAGHGAVVCTLLEAGADAEICDWWTGWTALVLASRYGHEVVVRALLAAGVDPTRATRFGNTAMCEAVAGGYAGVVQALQEASRKSPSASLTSTRA